MFLSSVPSVLRIIILSAFEEITPPPNLGQIQVGLLGKMKGTHLNLKFR